MKRLIWILLLAPAFAQSPNLGLTLLPHNAPNWDTATNANWNKVDNVFGIATCAYIGWDATAKQLTCPGGVFVSLSPSADQTITGNHALINTGPFIGSELDGPLGVTTPAAATVTTLNSDLAIDCASFSGATVDVKVNACLAAVVAAGGGTADARGLGGNQSIAAQITVGDGTAPVTLLLPVAAVWSPDAITNNTDCALYQNGNTTIISQNYGGSSGFQISSSSSAARLNAMYCSNPAGGVYLRLDGVKFRNQGHITASGVGFFFQGSFDNSTVSNVTVYDFEDTYAAEINHACCSTTFYNFTVNAENTVGATGLYILGNEPSPPTNESLQFYSLSVDAPGNGFPNIKASDPGASHRSKIDIFGLYEEGNTTDTTTTMNQIDGVDRFTVHGATLKTTSGGTSTQAAFSLTNTANTLLSVNGLSMVFGASYPRTAIINNNTTSCASAPCNIPTDDSRGNLASFTTGKITALGVKSSTYGTNTNCAAAGTAANPSVASCSVAPAGSFSCATNASTGTCTVNTTAVTANSRIFVMPSAAEGANLSVTCNTTADTGLTAPRLASKSAGTSFTINLGTYSTNPECFSYWIVN